MLNKTNYLKQLKAQLNTEPWCIVIKLDQTPLPISITYNTRTSKGRITHIEELTLDGDVKAGCRFSGRKSFGVKCEQWLIELKPILSKLKSNDWQYTTQYLQEHAKNV